MGACGGGFPVYRSEKEGRKGGFFVDERGGEFSLSLSLALSMIFGFYIFYLFFNLLTLKHKKKFV